jgi:GNAT superfamily N-acetyltransferase
MAKAKIRTAETKDREELVEMRLQMQHHMEASNPRVWHVTIEGRQGFYTEVDEMLADQDGEIIVAEADEGLVGYTYGRVAHRANYTPGGVGFINGIYVQEHLRRRGIGTRLIQELCRFFKTHSVEEANLRYVLGNREAEGFWRSLGFKPVLQTANTPLEALERRLKRRPKQSKPYKQMF